MGISPSISVVWRRQQRRRIRTRGRKRRKRVVRLIIMYTAAEMRVHFLREHFFQNVFIPDFCVLQPTVIETGFCIFLTAKYCPALDQHCADAGGWRESGPPVRVTVGLSIFELCTLLPPGCQHQSAQCPLVFIREHSPLQHKDTGEKRQQC